VAQSDWVFRPRLQGSSHLEMVFMTAIALAAVASLAFAQDWAALDSDDVCHGLDGEDCSLSLRQLRGQEKAAEVAQHAAPFEAPEGPGFCCYSGSKSGDMCGSCRAESIAKVGTYCDGESKCGGCGGTWCTTMCVMGAEDKNDMCGTAYESAIASSDNYCAESKSNCAGCSGAWCGKGPKSTEAEQNDADQTSAAEAVSVSSSPGFCCFSGTSQSDTCGTCYPTAIAKATDTCAATENACGGCGGTWCKASCVMGSSDPEDACGTAYATAIAKSSDFCAQSEERCSSCKGTWCTEAKLKMAES